MAGRCLRRGWAARRLEVQALQSCAAALMHTRDADTASLFEAVLQEERAQVDHVTQIEPGQDTHD